MSWSFSFTAKTRDEAKQIVRDHATVTADEAKNLGGDAIRNGFTLAAAGVALAAIDALPPEQDGHNREIRVEYSGHIDQGDDAKNGNVRLIVQTIALD